MKKVIAEDLLPLLSEINKKTLLIWGTNDKMVPIKYARIFEQNINGSRMEILPKVGHSPNFEVPQKTSQLILDFIKSSAS